MSFFKVDAILLIEDFADVGLRIADEGFARLSSRR